MFTASTYSNEYAALKKKRHAQCTYGAAFSIRRNPPSSIEGNLPGGGDQGAGRTLTIAAEAHTHVGIGGKYYG